MLTNGVVSVLTILKNPMILLGLVSMGIFLGMPYLIDNSTSHPIQTAPHLFRCVPRQANIPPVDPEMRAEFEERQKSNPVNSILSGQQSTPNPMGDFDMAAYLAGSKKEGKNGGKR